jgi:hypothetical protein
MSRRLSSCQGLEDAVPEVLAGAAAEEVRELSEAAPKVAGAVRHSHGDPRRVYAALSRNWAWYLRLWVSTGEHIDPFFVLIST